MTVAMDFGAVPPEINSARIYSGPGAAPMLTAARAWDGLAAELRSTAADYSSAICALTIDGWRGPASTSMAAAAAPYAAWINTTAAQAEQTAIQATAAAGAYEAAFVAMVPPPVIAANRAQLTALIATNLLGQNSAAIAATEAHYGEMWAQDAAAMYGYAGSSAVATRLTSFIGPTETINPSGLAGQAAAVSQAGGSSADASLQGTLSQLISVMPTALQGLASPTVFMPSSVSSSGISEIAGLLTGGGSGNAQLDALWSVWGPNANIWNSIFSSGFFMPSNTLGAFTSLFGAGAAGEALGEAASGGLGAGLAEPLGGISGLGGLGGAVSGGLGNAASIGPLSVPPSWTTVAPPPISPLASAMGGSPLTAPAAAAPGMPAFAPMGAGERASAGSATADTRFLVRPPMVPPWSAAG